MRWAAVGNGTVAFIFAMQIAQGRSA